MTEKKPPIVKSDFKNTSYFDDEIFEMIPNQLKQATKHHSKMKRMRDIILFSMIHILSATIPKVYGIYFGKKVFANLYGVICGPAATGKHVMLHPRNIGKLIHAKLQERNREKIAKYKAEIKEWEANGKSTPEPERPRIELFFIPTNSSAAGLVQLLADSCRGLMFSTEVDTLRLVFEQKFGDFSDLLRAVYHHEPYSTYRKTNNELIELEDTCLTLLLSGTPEQLKTLIKSAENGMFSRIGCYVYDDTSVFENPFKEGNREIQATFDTLAIEFCEMYFELEAGDPKEFKFTPEQEIQFTTRFSEQLDDCQTLIGSDGASAIVRQGIIFFRIAMILSVIRHRSQSSLTCSDEDFTVAGKIVNVLSEHSTAVLSCLPVPAIEANGVSLLADDFFKSLPPSFNTKQLIEPIMKRGISKRQAYRLIQQLINVGRIRKSRFGQYEKIN